MGDSYFLVPNLVKWGEEGFNLLAYHYDLLNVTPIPNKLLVARYWQALQTEVCI